MPSTALRDLKEAPGHRWKREEERMGGQERTGHSYEPWLPVECWDTDLWAVLTEGGVNL